MTYKEWRFEVEEIIREMTGKDPYDIDYWDEEYEADYRAGMTPAESAERALAE